MACGGLRSVTGGTGFLGSYMVERLRAEGCGLLTVPRSRDHDLLTVPRSRDHDLRDPQAVARLLRDTTPHTVIHLAAVVGGIGANGERPELCRIYREPTQDQALFAMTRAVRRAAEPEHSVVVEQE